jgi:hypothetical protein
MNHHFRVLEQGIESVAVGRNRPASHIAREQRERGRGKNQHREEEHLYAGQNRARVCVELDIRLVGQAENEAVGSQQPRPQKQRSLLAAPQRSELVWDRQRPVGVFKDVGDGEIVGKDRPDESKRGPGDGHEPRNSSPASGIGQNALPGRFAPSGPWQSRPKLVATPPLPRVGCKRPELKR